MTVITVRPERPEDAPAIGEVNRLAFGRAAEAELVEALRRAGLAVEHLGEHPETYWNGFPNLAPELCGKIPMTFSLLARRA